LVFQNIKGTLTEKNAIPLVKNLSNVLRICPVITTSLFPFAILNLDKAISEVRRSSS
jgi:hypothetical protein